ncbi:cache domain-containing sensor histidine kinase ['Paenibacillus yunnanensis' Narsing Rao et al. 2020]|uniref:cache domain-containing sensor histidine kinase n=1 Tax=Paenibacillus tengchongensis TaxID=2608684 RepID=UPI00124F55B4|nr:sensor histidine kinase [Paenibacillus tengchongensis]
MKKWFDTLSKTLFLYNFSIRSRLILYFLFLVLLPTTIISVTVYNKSTGIITRNVTTSIENNLNLVQDNLAQRFAAADSTMTALYLNSEFADLISSNRPTDSTGIINELAALNKILENFPAGGASGSSYVTMLYMLNRPEYTQYNFSRRVYNIDLISLKPWYLSIPARSDFTVVGLSSLDSRYTLKFAKRLFGIRHAQLPYIGLLTIDIPLTEFSPLLDHYKPTPGSQIYIADQSGTIAISPEESLIGQNISTQDYYAKLSASPADSGTMHSFRHVLDGKNMLVSYKQIAAGWTILSFSPVSELNGELASFQRVMYIAIGSCMLVSLMMALLLSENISAPIRKFIQSMSHAESGNFNIIIRYRRKDEFAYLFDRYNKLLQQIKALIDKLYVTELRKKEAELKTLQAQINPHFLYNTLDSINWLAINHDVPEISQMVTSLSDFFRYSLSKGKNIIPLRDELKQVESYLEIQQFRFQDKLEYELEETDPRLLAECLVVKLSIQPLVENAIIHGIQRRRGKGRIRIRVTASPETLCVLVFDDGVGADPEKLNALLTGPRPGNQSYGIRNVHTRVQQFFGEAYGIHYYANTEAETGLLAVVRFPVVTTWDEVKEDVDNDRSG